jgi:hypothetical protein
VGRGDERRPFAETQGKQKSRGTVDSPVLTNVFLPEMAVQIFQPVEWNEQCQAFFSEVMKVGNTIVYFDEIAQLVTASHVPTEFNVLWTQGAAINVGAWCATQRPKNIPVIVKDQAEWWFMFRVINYDDRRVVEGYVPVEDTPEMIDEELPYRWFWFWQDDMERPVLVKPLNIEKKVA